MKMHAKVLVDWRCGKVRETYDEAEAMYTKALRLEPDNVVALRDYAGASPRVYPLL
jgi:cytochrome c-type biogenesis protein CcmH/NrfG